VRPKVEEFVQMDESAVILQRGSPAIPDSVAARMPALDLPLNVLVDERGRIVLASLPWTPPDQMSPVVVSGVVGSLTRWRFRAAMKNNAPHAVWATVEYSLEPPRPQGSNVNAPH
jgi:hypothetical protein